MGLSSSKTTSGPSKAAMPYLKTASSAVQGAYDANQGNVENITRTLGSAFDGLGAANPTLTSASTYVQDVLGGKYLDQQNPYLEDMIGTAKRGVTDDVNAIFSRAGQTGSSRQIGELGSRLSEAELGLRSQSYNAEMARRDAAVASALGLDNAETDRTSTQAQLGQLLATLPLTNASFLADSLGGLWGNSTTTKTTGNLGQMLIGAASNAAGAIAGK